MQYPNTSKGRVPSPPRGEDSGEGDLQTNQIPIRRNIHLRHVAKSVAVYFLCVPRSRDGERGRRNSDALNVPFTSLRWCAKVLMMRMHRPRHEALSASSPGGERGGWLLSLSFESRVREDDGVGPWLVADGPSTSCGVNASHAFTSTAPHCAGRTNGGSAPPAGPAFAG